MDHTLITGVVRTVYGTSQRIRVVRLSLVSVFLWILSCKPQSQDSETLASRSHCREGIASWYGPGFWGRRTANGEWFKKGDREFTAAHPTLPFNTKVTVYNKQNGNSVVVRINDRGPYVRGRCIDLNQSAKLAIGGGGTFPAVLSWPGSGDGSSIATKGKKAPITAAPPVRKSCEIYATVSKDKKSITVQARVTGTKTPCATSALVKDPSSVSATTPVKISLSQKSGTEAGRGSAQINVSSNANKLLISLVNSRFPTEDWEKDISPDAEAPDKPNASDVPETEKDDNLPPVYDPGVEPPTQPSAEKKEDPPNPYE